MIQSDDKKSKALDYPGLATMIGGTDLIIETTGGHAALETALRIVQQKCPQAVFENARTGEKCKGCNAVGEAKELFVYRDDAIAREWDDKGAVLSLANTMIHFLRGEDGLTIVTDNPEETVLKRLIDSIRDALSAPQSSCPLTELKGLP